jgi:O-antigen/teichoic acid export membrane protein
LALGEIKKQSILSTLTLAIGVLLGFYLKLFAFPAYLEPKEIALLTVLLDFSNIMASIIPLGSQLIFMRYLPKFGIYSNEAKYLRKQAFILTLFGLSLFTLLFFAFKAQIIGYYQDNAPLLSKYFLVILPLVVVRVSNSLATAYSKGQKKSVFPVISQDILVRVFTIAAILLYSQHVLNFDGLVASYLALYFVTSSLIWISVKKLGGWDVDLKAKAFTKEERKDILVYGAFSIFTNAGVLMIRSIDSIMLTTLKDLDAAGIYAIAFFIGILVEIPRRAISNISFSFLSEAFANNKMDQIKSIYQKSALNQLLAGALVYLCIVASLGYLFQIIPNGEIYAPASMVVVLIGMAKLVDVSSGGNGEVLANSPFYRYNFASLAILGPLAIVTNIIFIPKLGYVGAAWASLLSMFLVNAFRFFIIYWKYKMLPISSNWIKSLVMVLILFAASTYIPTLDNPYLGVIVNSSIIGGLFLLSTYYFKLSPDFVELVNTKILRK